RAGHDRSAVIAVPSRRYVDEREEALRHRGEAAERRELDRGPHPVRVREDLEEQPAEEAVAERTPGLLLDGRAGGLDQTVVADARGAGRDARHAAETAIEVLAHGRAQAERSVEASVDQVDAAARRVHLLVPEHVGRAGRQAEPAVDAVGRDLPDHPDST